MTHLRAGTACESSASQGRRPRRAVASLLTLVGCCLAVFAILPLSAVGDEVIIAGERQSAPTIPHQGAPAMPPGSGVGSARDSIRQAEP
jgi:hypothetical protein